MRYFLLFFLSLLSFNAFAETYTGEIVLAPGTFYDDKPATIKHEGDISYTVKLYVDDFVGNEAIFAHTEVENNSKETGIYVFYAAFLDSNGDLVAACRHRTTLRPGQHTQLGGMYAEVSPDEWKRVSVYKLKVTKLEQ